MAKPDWLSIDDISHLWSEETGLDASALRNDLETWFAEFVEQPLTSRQFAAGLDVDTVTANRLMGKFGVRYLEKKTFETYCEERGFQRPDFWFAGQQDDSWRDESSQTGSGLSPTEVTSLQKSEGRSYGTKEIGPALAASQAHLLNRGPNETSAEPSQQELIERAAAALVRARQLRSQLEATIQKTADLSAKIEASRAATMAEVMPSDPALSETLTDQPSASLKPEQPAAISGRPPQTSGQHLRQTPTRQRRRGRAILTAGLALSLVTLMALGAGMLIRQADNMPLSPPTETAGPVIDRDLATREEPAGGPTGATLAARIPPEMTAHPLEAEAGRSEPRDQNMELLSGPQASSIADPMTIKEQLADAQHEIERLSAAIEASAAAQAEATRLRGENARLTNELVKAQAIAGVLRQIQQQAEIQATARQQSLKDAVAASLAQVATLQRELDIAHKRIADLSQAVGSTEDEAMNRPQELTARQPNTSTNQIPGGAGAKAPSDQPALAQSNPDQIGGAEGLEAAPEIEEILTASELPPDPEATKADNPGDIVSLEDLLREPDQYVDREVVVTGPVVWLLRRYWLNSESGDRRLLLDVEGLRSDARKQLEDAVVKFEFLAQIQARIRGIVERQGAADYRLAAFDLLLVN